MDKQLLDKIIKQYNNTEDSDESIYNQIIDIFNKLENCKGFHVNIYQEFVHTGNRSYYYTPIDDHILKRVKCIVHCLNMYLACTIKVPISYYRFEIKMEKTSEFKCRICDHTTINREEHANEEHPPEHNYNYYVYGYEPNFYRYYGLNININIYIHNKNQKQILGTMDNNVIYQCILT